MFKVVSYSREVYITSDNGAIGRPRINMKPSGKWKARALVRFNNFGHIVERVPFDNWRQFLESKPAWTYKNGKPRYFLEDLDHGTTRIQMEGVINVNYLS